LDINLDGELPIQPDGVTNDGEDDMAEMEKLLKSGGAFGGNKNLSNTFKKIRGEIAANDEVNEDESMMEGDDLDNSNQQSLQ